MFFLPTSNLARKRGTRALLLRALVQIPAPLIFARARGSWLRPWKAFWICLEIREFFWAGSGSVTQMAFFPVVPSRANGALIVCLLLEAALTQKNSLAGKAVV